LADPDGKSHPYEENCGIIGGCKYNDNIFSSPEGVKELDGKTWGGLTVDDIIIR
jgi:hypothetical protein